MALEELREINFKPARRKTWGYWGSWFSLTSGLVVASFKGADWKTIGVIVLGICILYWGFAGFISVEKLGNKWLDSKGKRINL